MECNRRSFLRRMSIGALGLGFGVSVFPRVFRFEEALAQTESHDLHTRGTINFKGYWEKRGSSDEAVIPIMVEILMPMDGKRIPLGHYLIGIIALGGRYGIRRVRVSVDGGEWREAELKPPLSKWAWSS